MEPNFTDPCQEASGQEGEYLYEMHLASVGIIFACSFFGVILPVIITKFPQLSLPQSVFNFGKFYGAGVILSTAFIHMMPGAVLTLTDSCLPSLFQDYEAWAGLIAMFAALILHLIEYLATSLGVHVHSHGPEVADDTIINDGEKEEDVFLKKMKISTFILEGAIAIHSIIIGADLGVNTEEFYTLLVALCFHQFFEGLGLGYRLAEVRFENRWTVVFNIIFYSLTTPCGIAIGIGLFKSNIASGTNMMIAKGVLDSLSAGFLIYSSLVSIISEEYKRKSFATLPPYQKFVNFVALYLGAASMAVIGIWA
eukprot:TRINITY_DN12357_c0_g1_i1.p1 TRINITY_DN12357_c0_g1~~TRINITY_DN12357_c0_g1_i1.p1  ORF type:complete len:310 (+),score=-4.39 TRINITY_DN12357_c0_g1_i1:16-945(+)